MSTAPALNLVIKVVDRHSTKGDFIEQAFLSCTQVLCESAEDDLKHGRAPLKGWAVEEIFLILQDISLVLESKNGYPCFNTQIRLYARSPLQACMNTQEPIGRFCQITRLDGTIEDQYLVIKDIKSSQQQADGVR